MGPKKTDIDNDEQDLDQQLEDQREEALDFSRFPKPVIKEEEPAEEAVEFSMDEGEEEEAAKPVVAESTELEAGAEEGEEAEGKEAEQQAEPEKIYTLPDGRKVKFSEMTPDLLEKAIIGWNNQSHHADLLQRSNQQLTEAQAAIQQLQQGQQELNLWRQQQALAAQQEQTRRPSADNLRNHYAGFVQQLLADKRITEDEAADHGGMIAEYAYDQQLMRGSHERLAEWVVGQLTEIRSQLGVVSPQTEELRAEAQESRRRSVELQVQAKAAEEPGYEKLADPAEWKKLKEYVIADINASRDAQGNPTYAPSFTPEMVRRAWDAMMAPVWRAGSQKAAQQAENDQAIARKRASGPPASKAGKRPAGKQPPPPLTPQEEAMDFRDPRKAMA